MTTSKITRSLRSIAKTLDNKKTKQLIDVSSGGLHFNAFAVQFDIVLRDSHNCAAQFDSVDQFELCYSDDKIDSDVEPMWESAESLTLTKDGLDGLVWCSIACDTTSTRYQLGGVCIACDSFVGTDGRRMHTFKHGFSLSADTSAIVANSTIKAVLELVAIWRDKTVQIEIGQFYITFSGKYWKLRSQLVEGRYPNWLQVMPRTELYTCQSEIDAKPIRTELKLRVKSKALENKIAISTMNASERKTFDAIPAKWTTATSTCERNSNPVVIDAKFGLNAIDGLERVNMWTRTPDEPVVIGYGHRIAVVMPLRA